MRALHLAVLLVACGASVRAQEPGEPTFTVRGDAVEVGSRTVTIQVGGVDAGGGSGTVMLRAKAGSWTGKLQLLSATTEAHDATFSLKVGTTDVTTTDVVFHEGQWVAVTVTVSALRVVEPQRIPLLLVREKGTATQIGTVDFRWMPAPRVKVLGAGNDGLKWTEYAAVVSRTVWLESQVGPQKGVRVHLQHFGGAEATLSRADGTRLAPDEAIDLPGETPLPVVLEATLSELGAHTGALVVTTAGRRETTALQLTRAAPTITIAGLDPAPVAWPSSSSAVLAFTLEEGNGARADVGTPYLELARLTNNVKVTGERALRFVVRGEKGEPLIDRVPLAAGARHLTLEVWPLTEAGHYTGSLVVPVPGGQAVRQPVTIYVKWATWIGVACATLGTFVSYGIRNVFVRSRLRAIVRNRVVAALHRLQAERSARGLTEAQVGVLGDLEEQLRSVDVAAGTDDLAVKALDLLDQKLWLFRRWREVSTAARAVAAYAPDVARAELDAAQQAIRSATTVEAVKLAAAALEVAPPKITAEALKKLREAAQPYLSDHDPSVQAGAREALRLADSAQVTAAMDALDGVQATKARTFAEELRAWLGAGKPPTVGSAAWEKARKELEPRLEAVRQAPSGRVALETYRWIRRDLYLALAKDLRDQVGKELEAKPGDAPLGAEVARLDAAILLLASGDIDGGQRGYDAAAQAAAARRPSGGGTLMSHEASPRTGGPAPSGPTTLPRVSITTAEPARSMADSVELHECALAFTVALLAGLIGIKTLSFDGLSWGGAGDCVVAFLWGLGLHQASGKAFESDTLKKTLTGES